MAMNMVYTFNRERARERQVPAGTLSGAPLLINGRPCVALTARGDSTNTKVLADGTTITRNVGGASNAFDSASVAYDGTWEFTIAGIPTNTAQDTAVYITAGNVLTLLLTGNTLFGYTDYPRDYTKTVGIAPVRIF